MSKILALDSQKIYVVGNHDYDMTELLGKYGRSANSDLTILYDKYPEEENPPLEFGDRKYLFLHGHQFDKLFLAVGPLWRVQSFIYRNAGAIGKAGWFTVGIFLIALALTIAKWIRPQLVFLDYQWLLLVIGLTAVPATVRFWKYSQGWVWYWLKKYLFKRAKYKPTDDIIRARLFDMWRRSLPPSTPLNADTIVFAHTHIPETKYSDTLKLHFINTGSWVDEEEQTHDTFLYIDDLGYQMFVWDEGKRHPVPFEM